MLYFFIILYYFPILYSTIIYISIIHISQTGRSRFSCLYRSIFSGHKNTALISHCAISRRLFILFEVICRRPYHSGSHQNTSDDKAYAFQGEVEFNHTLFVPRTFLSILCSTRLFIQRRASSICVRAIAFSLVANCPC